MTRKAKNFDGLIPLESGNPATWINQNAPKSSAIDDLQKELTKIGGVIPPGNGEFSGKPVFRLAFGQTETEYSGGRQRIRFRDARIPRLVTFQRFILPPEVFSRFTGWKADFELRKYEKFVQGDLSALTQRVSLGEYLRRHEMSAGLITLDSVTLPERNRSELVRHIPVVSAPPDWLYITDIEKITDVGRQCWYVLRWLSGKNIGGKRSWEENRYDTNVFVPEFGAEIPFVDILGPFPKKGAYTAFLEIADYKIKGKFEAQTGDEEISEDDGGYDYMKYEYLSPSYQNTIEPVKEELFNLSAKKILPRAEQELRDSFKVVEQFGAKLKKQHELLDDFMKHCAPAFPGVAKKFQTNKENL